MVEDIDKIFPDNREKYQNESKLRQVQLVELRILRIFDYICNKHNIDYWLDWGTLLGAARHGGFIPWDDDIDVAVPCKNYKKLIAILKKELPDDLFVQTLETDSEFSNRHLTRIRDNYSTLGNNNNYGTSYHNGIFIDILPVYKLPEDKLLRFILLKLYRLLISPRFKLKKLKNNKINHKRVIRIIKWGIRRYISTFVCLFMPFNSLEEKILNIYKIGNNYIYGYHMDTYDKNYFDESDLFPLNTIEYEGFIFSAPNNIDKYLTIQYGNYKELPPIENRKPHHINLNEVEIFRPSYPKYIL